MTHIRETGQPSHHGGPHFRSDIILYLLQVAAAGKVPLLAPQQEIDLPVWGHGRRWQLDSLHTAEEGTSQLDFTLVSNLSQSPASREKLGPKTTEQEGSPFWIVEEHQGMGGKEMVTTPQQESALLDSRDPARNTQCVRETCSHGDGVFDSLWENGLELDPVSTCKPPMATRVHEKHTRQVRITHECPRRTLCGETQHAESPLSSWMPWMESTDSCTRIRERGGSGIHIS